MPEPLRDAQPDADRECVGEPVKDGLTVPEREPGFEGGREGDCDGVPSCVVVREPVARPEADRDMVLHAVAEFDREEEAHALVVTVTDADGERDLVRVPDGEFVGVVTSVGGRVCVVDGVDACEAELVREIVTLAVGETVTEQDRVLFADAERDPEVDGDAVSVVRFDGSVVTRGVNERFEDGDCVGEPDTEPLIDDVRLRETVALAVRHPDAEKEGDPVPLAVRHPDAEKDDERLLAADAVPLVVTVREPVAAPLPEGEPDTDRDTVRFAVAEPSPGVVVRVPDANPDVDDDAVPVGGGGGFVAVAYCVASEGRPVAVGGRMEGDGGLEAVDEADATEAVGDDEGQAVAVAEAAAVGADGAETVALALAVADDAVEADAALDGSRVASALALAEAGAVGVGGRVPRVGAAVDEPRELGDSPPLGDALIDGEVSPLALAMADCVSAALAVGVSGAPETSAEAVTESVVIGDSVSVDVPLASAEDDGVVEPVSGADCEGEGEGNGEPASDVVWLGAEDTDRASVCVCEPDDEPLAESIDDPVCEGTINVGVLLEVDDVLGDCVGVRVELAVGEGEGVSALVGDCE